MNSVMDKIVFMDEIYHTCIWSYGWILTKHLMVNDWSPHAIGCKDLKWTKRAGIEKNNEICQKREIDEMKTFES
jgi:hypothetical protein